MRAVPLSDMRNRLLAGGIRDEIELLGAAAAGELDVERRWISEVQVLLWGHGVGLWGGVVGCGDGVGYGGGAKKENHFLTYGGNGVRHMGKRGCVGELNKKERYMHLSTPASPRAVQAQEAMPRVRVRADGTY